MEDTPVTVIGIIIAAIMMFLVPLVTIADRNDDIAQLVVQTETAEFVDKIIKTGKITDEDYQTYLLNLASSGNTYQVDIEIKILDENTSKNSLHLSPCQLSNSSSSFLSSSKNFKNF